MHGVVAWLMATRVRAIFAAAVLAILALTPLFVTWLPGAFIVLLGLRGSQPVSEVKQFGR